MADPPCPTNQVVGHKRIMGKETSFWGTIVGAAASVIGGAADVKSTACDASRDYSDSCESAREISRASAASDVVKDEVVGEVRYGK